MSRIDLCNKQKWRKVRKKEAERKYKISKIYYCREEALTIFIENKTNQSSMNCYSEILDASLLTSEQLAIITVVNLILMIANVTVNTLVIYVLIKTKQILQISCKPIFLLSTSDLLLGVFCQNLFLVIIFSKKCSVIEASYSFLSAFLLHSSCYTVALIGVDHYLRIKHYGDFRNFWTTRVVLKFTCVSVFLALLQAVLVLTTLVYG